MPKQSSLSSKTIAFRHPRYEDNDENNLILDLPGFDHDSGAIHHGTALTVCGIIACNTWNGYFTLTRDGSRIPQEYDDLLFNSEYYFHHPDYEDSEDAYPLFACFSDWMFPHGRLPPSFTSIVPTSTACTPREETPAANLSQTVIDRDLTCRVSGYDDGLESAHLCPTNEGAWWRRNRMSRYCKNKHLPSNSITADVNNVIALRKDIHHIMDDQRFAIVPKAETWKVAFFGPTKNLGGKYHNRAFMPLSPEVQAAFLLVRLAWTVFPLARDFMEAGPRRKIMFRDEDGKRKELWKRGEEIRLSHGQSTRRDS